MIADDLGYIGYGNKCADIHATDQFAEFIDFRTCDDAVQDVFFCAADQSFSADEGDRPAKVFINGIGDLFTFFCDHLKCLCLIHTGLDRIDDA